MMDAARYERVRKLFLAVEELPPPDRETYLRNQIGDDPDLFQEVWSLLAEHDPDSAKAEGERAIPLPNPGRSSGPSSLSHAAQDAETVGHAKSSGSTTDVDRDTDALEPQRPARRVSSSEITQQGAARTHASPRDHDADAGPRGSAPRLWADLRRKSRRRTSGWLWLAALVPTALVGFWTYRQVESTIRESLMSELGGVADSVSLTARRYLDYKAQMVQAWVRQPGVQTAVVDLTTPHSGADAANGSQQAQEIESQLQMLSGSPNVQFVLWDDTFRVVGGSVDSGAIVGTPVDPNTASDLSRAMSGQTVLYGPERVDLDEPDGAGESGDRESDPLTDSDEPITEMAMIVPVRGVGDTPVGTMMVRGIDLFEQFNQTLDEVAVAGRWDTYAVNAEGVMISNSQYAVSLAQSMQLDVSADQIAGQLRVADPGKRLTPSNLNEVQRAILPLTVAVANVRTGARGSRIDAYRNYAGREVVGAWRWDNKWQMGIVVEQDAQQSFAPVRIVRLGFLVLGSLLTITAFGTAAKIARTSTAEQASVHPLSRYEILSELGSGGMGVVYRARHKQLGRDAALKVLRSDRHSHEDRLRFDREARLAASLKNPHSVGIYDYGHSEGGEAFCVMEFLYGLTLQEVVARGGHQPVGRVIFILRQICDALAEAHGMNLLHRDIKPQNVMLSLDASVGDWAVVFDFGLAKPLVPDASVYQTSETVWAGTPMYMAPERFREPGNMDPRSDIYSVGCVAYFMLSGRPPFIESNPESLFALIISEHPISIQIHRGEPLPLEVKELVDRCMAKSAEDRFASIEDLSRRLEELRARFPWTLEDARAWWKQHGSEG